MTIIVHTDTEGVFEISEVNFYDSDQVSVECQAFSTDGDPYTEIGWGSNLEEAIRDLRRRLERGS